MTTINPNVMSIGYNDMIASQTISYGVSDLRIAMMEQAGVREASFDDNSIQHEIDQQITEAYNAGFDTLNKLHQQATGRSMGDDKRQAYDILKKNDYRLVGGSASISHSSSGNILANNNQQIVVSDGTNIQSFGDILRDHGVNNAATGTGVIFPKNRVQHTRDMYENFVKNRTHTVSMGSNKQAAPSFQKAA